MIGPIAVIVMLCAIVALLVEDKEPSDSPNLSEVDQVPNESDEGKAP